MPGPSPPRPEDAPPWAADWRRVTMPATVRPRPARGPIVWLALVCVAIVGVLALGARWWSEAIGSARSETAGTLTVTGAGSIATAVDPTLVDITATLAYQTDTEVDGTGVVLSAGGLVLTNNHVITGASQISAVDVGTGQQFTATVLGYDRGHDLALLQLAGAAGLPAARLGDSSRVKVGDAVVGLGNAGGKGGKPAAAAGTVVALDQRIESVNVYDNTSEKLDHIIATDADIEPGDSGGPLVDRYGRVIGIDTAGSRGALSFLAKRGFAIPIDAAMSEVRIIQAGESSDTIHVGQTAFLGVEAGSHRGDGLAVTQVVADGPAAQAGLTSGDVIVALDDRPVDSPEALSAVLCRHQPGDAVEMVWQDASGARHSSVVLFATGPPA